MKNIAVVCFDMWDTLCHGGGKKQMKEVRRALNADHVPYKKFLKQVEISLMTHPWSLKEGLTNLSEEIKIPVEKSLINQAAEVWLNYVINVQPFQETDHVLKKLKQKKLKLCLVSNTDITSIKIKISQLGWDKYLDHQFISAKLEILKPDKKIFQAIENYYQIPKNQVLFVDDSLYHGVYPARQFGWQGLWLTREKSGNDPGKINSLNEVLSFC